MILERGINCRASLQGPWIKCRKRIVPSARSSVCPNKEGFVREYEDALMLSGQIAKLRETNMVLVRNQHLLIYLCKGMGKRFGLAVPYIFFNHPNFIYVLILLIYSSIHPSILILILHPSPVCSSCFQVWYFSRLCWQECFLHGCKPSCACVHVCSRLQFFLHWLNSQYYLLISLQKRESRLQSALFQIE